MCARPGSELIRLSLRRSFVSTSARLSRENARASHSREHRGSAWAASCACVRVSHSQMQAVDSVNRGRYVRSAQLTTGSPLSSSRSALHPSSSAICDAHVQIARTHADHASSSGGSIGAGAPFQRDDRDSPLPPGLLSAAVGSSSAPLQPHPLPVLNGSIVRDLAQASEPEHRSELSPPSAAAAGSSWPAAEPVSQSQLSHDAAPGGKDRALGDERDVLLPVADAEEDGLLDSAPYASDSFHGSRWLPQLSAAAVMRMSLSMATRAAQMLRTLIVETAAIVKRTARTVAMMD